MNYPEIKLKPGKERSLRRYHPWVFQGAVANVEDDSNESPADGEVVRVVSSKNKYLGTGHFQSKGSISVRVFDFQDNTIDNSYWKGKLQAAIELRKQADLVGDSSTNAFRLINAEGDGMPGLITDFYNGTLVMQCHSMGMYNIREALASLFTEILGDQLHSVYDKSHAVLHRYAGTELKDGYLINKEKEDQKIEITENGCRFKIDIEKGQKTGFFIDQRESRNLLSQFAKDKTVLNTFSYSGGFSIYALNAGAKEVVSVDSSEGAIKLSEENAELNEFTNHKAIVSDVQEFLKENQIKYDIIVVDPPAFAKHKKARHKAVQAYKRLNTAAMQSLEKGGLLFTFSCSQVIDKKLFKDTITAAAIESGKSVSILSELSQPTDHPVNIFHPEGDYLKGLILRITE